MREAKGIGGEHSRSFLVMEDLDATLTPEDKSAGSPIHDSETKDFSEFMVVTRMNNIRTYGREYVLINNDTYSRFDRDPGNSSCMNIYGHVQVHIMEPQFSDHSPLRIYL